VVLTVQTTHGRVVSRAEAPTLGDACRALAAWTVRL
jgi:hypothetical protein